MTVLAIDQGTSATKAVVVASDGTVLSLAEASIQVVARSDGAVELDPEELWASVVAAATEALAAAGNPTLTAIGLANQGETVMAWDRSTGIPKGPAIVWQDRRAEVICNRLREHADFLAEHTGLQLDPYFVAPKLVWLREQIGDGPTITTTDAWMLHRLCGAFATDVSTAGRSLLLDLDTAEWSTRACEIFGIDPATLPAVVGNADQLGFCDLFGGSVPVTGTCVDQQAALFAEHCHEAGEAKCTYGTGAFMLACSG
ncbi:MAG: FGGY family carbohydrate kinase, partial [Ilumatobacteraceae bacterium]